MSKAPRARRTTPREVVIALSLDELRALKLIADHYKRSMGPMRYVVRLTASAEVRAKYRFISEESLWLKRFIESTLQGTTSGSANEIEVEFASRTVIAYWGRVLSSLHSKRARRRMKAADVAVREVLNEKLRDAATRLEARWPGSIDRDLQTRRPQEVAWIQEQLRGNRSDMPEASGADQAAQSPSA